MMYSFLLFTVLIGSTISCKCVMHPALSEDFQKTPTIFMGSVVSKSQSPTLIDAVEYTMKVEEAYKSTSVGAILIVRARVNGASCGIGDISVGDQWQMWLSEDGTTNSCTRSTSDITENRAELQQLANQ
ncbi:unnamed protein product [Adineta steineri]|uniref:NTR domain-containing protein n=1 Tax=Adineta steineri TaxID=433720 RepID=A0A813Y319_9BILA|nr:unnamed protein product [Adineta steineri]